MSEPLKISCYIRAKNEERMIADVIAAALRVCDEVIVLDSGSTDRTCEVSAAAGARVIDSPWLGGGKQKRLGEEAAVHDWVLDLDADEIVSEELAEEIRALFADGEPPCPVYRFHMITAPPVGPMWHGVNVVDRTKLYDKRAIRARDHANWDQLEIPKGMKVGVLRQPLLHYSFRDLAQLNEKFNRNSSGRAEHTKLKPLPYVALRMVFGRPFYFFQHYVLRGMWKGGLYGFAVADIAAHGRWLKDAKMLEIHLRKRDVKAE